MLIPLEPRPRPPHPHLTGTSSTELNEWVHHRLRLVQTALDGLAAIRLFRPLTPFEQSTYHSLGDEEVKLLDRVRGVAKPA